jgi:hypothetical protein
MGARKGQNNFKETQSRKIETGKQKITLALNKIKKGTIFKTNAALINYLAAETGFNRTTLSRNSEYAVLVRRFFASQPGGAGFIAERESTLEIEKAKNLALKIDLSNLKTENRRLKNIITSHTSVFSGTAPDPLAVPPAVSPKFTNAPPADIAFAETAMTLLLLLDRLTEKELGIVMDIKNKQLIDNTEFGEKAVIAHNTRARYFFDWLASRKLIAGLLGESNENESSEDTPRNKVW